MSRKPPSPLHAGGGAPKSPLGAQSHEMRRLIILFVLAAGVTGAILYSSRSPQRTRKPKAVNAGADQLDGVRIPNILSGGSKWNPPVDRLNEAIQDQAPRGRATPINKALASEMARLVHFRPHYHFMTGSEGSENGGYQLVSGEEITNPENARGFRAKPVAMSGIITSFDRVSSERFGLDPKVFPTQVPLLEGVMKLEDGGEVRFLEVQTEVRGQVTPVITGERYKLMGVFYRLIDEGFDPQVTRAFVFATRVRRALPLLLRDELSPDLADRILEMEKPENLMRLPHQDPTFFELLGYILNKKPEELLPEDPKEITLLEGRDPLHFPERYRLKPVQASGLLLYLKWESFEYKDMQPGDAPLLGYWHAILATKDPDRNTPVSVIFPLNREELPEQLTEFAYADDSQKLKMDRPWVDAQGLFFRVHAYTARGRRKRQEEVNVPVMIAAKAPIVSIAEPEVIEANPFLWSFIGVGILLACGLIIMMVRDRMKSKLLEDQLRQQRIVRRKSRGMDLNQEAAAGVPSGPASPKLPGNE